jgi:hypothetical protein
LSTSETSSRSYLFASTLDASNRIHISDNTVMPPVQKASILVREMPCRITFSAGGKYAYPPPGDVIDVKTRKIVATLEDQHYNGLQSKKKVGIQLRNGKTVAAGDPFGINQEKK